MFKAVVDKKKCTGCGLCVSYCPSKAISLDLNTDNKKKSSVKNDICKGCGACMAACRYGVITLE